MREYDDGWTLREAVERIAAAFREHADWMGYYSIRARGRLGMCPPDVYQAAMQDLVERGLLIAVSVPTEEYPVYMLTALTYGAGRRRAKGGKR